MASALNKGASAFTPKWMQKSGADAAPAPAAAESALAPSVAVAAAPVQATTAAPTTKLSSTAAAFVPKAKPPLTPTAQPVDTKPVVTSKPTEPTTLGATKTTAPSGQWAKGAPRPTVSPAAKPALAHGTVPPGALYKSPSHRPATPSTTPAAPPPLVITTKLNQAAREFRPKFLPMMAAAPTVTPPVTPPVQARPNPPSDLPPVSEASMPLSHIWNLYYIDRAVQNTKNFDPTLVYEIRSVEDFWRTFNNIPSLTRSDLGSTYFMFRDRIMPKWEDEANKNGGAWTIRLAASMDMDADAIDAVWETILCRCIGESWWTQHQNSVTGIVAKIRDRGFTVQFWVSQRMDDFPQDVATCIAHLHPAFKMDYVSHQAAADAAAERDETAAAEAAKKKSKKQRY